VNLPDPPMLVITDRHRCMEPLDTRADALFAGGCRWLSVRENDLDPATRRDLVRRLGEIGQPYGALITVHRDSAVAAECRVGLHLPAGSGAAAARQQLGRGLLLGLSCHDAADLAAAAGFDYVTLSPVFETRSKPGYGPAIGENALSRMTRESPCPVLALGGITRASLPALKGTGLAGIAVMGEAMATDQPAAWCTEMIAGLRDLTTASRASHKA
jgi:thiamine-phosphate pyrophosphorylase